MALSLVRFTQQKPKLRRFEMPGFDQSLFAKMIEARTRMGEWARKAAALKDEGKMEAARRAFATAERWEAKLKAYEKKLNQR